MKATGTTEFGKFLRSLRAARDETQEDTARILGCTKSYLSSVELGKQPIPSNWAEVLIKAYNLNDYNANKLKSLTLDITKVVKIDTEHLPIEKKHLALNLAGKIKHMSDATASEINRVLETVDGQDLSAMGGWETQEFRLLVGNGSHYSDPTIYPRTMFVSFIGYKYADGELIDCRNNPHRICLMCEDAAEFSELSKNWEKIKTCTVIKVRATVNNVRGLVDSRLFNAELLETEVNIDNDEKKIFDKYLSPMVLKGSFGEVVFNRFNWWFREAIDFDGYKVSVRIDKRSDGELYFNDVYDSLGESVQKLKYELKNSFLDTSDLWIVANNESGESEAVKTNDILNNVKLSKIECVCKYGYYIALVYRNKPLADTFVTFAPGKDINISGLYLASNHGLRPVGN